jgi:hypothetical protein
MLLTMQSVSPVATPGLKTQWYLEFADDRSNQIRVNDTHVAKDYLCLLLFVCSNLRYGMAKQSRVQEV